MPREAVCSGVSSSALRNFGEKFASRGHEENIKHVSCLLPHEANSSVAKIWLSPIHRSSKSIPWPTHVQSFEFKMGSDGVLSDVMLEERLVELWPEYSCL